MTGWRVLPLHVAPAEEQLALTETLWRDVAAAHSPPTLRWYSYSAPALILGIGQSETEINTETAREDALPIVKRSSGGAAVFAGPHLFALDVALPASSPLAVPDVVESYRWLGEAFQEALPPEAQLVPPTAARSDQQAQRGAPPHTPQRARALACFGVLSPYEVALASTRKLIGFSQIRKRGVVLYQAGFYTHFTGASLARYLPPLDGMSEELDFRIAHLAAIGVDAAGLIAAATEAIARRTPAA
ncbi:MAG TPA: ligase [Chloroflexota bacterium]|nr:ligase [Chloroflexota bacterium]